jgi:hypothetical protein
MEHDFVPAETTFHGVDLEDQRLLPPVVTLYGEGHRLQKSLERTVTEKCVLDVGAAVVARLRPEIHLGVGHSDLLTRKAFELVSQETTKTRKP